MSSGVLTGLVRRYALSHQVLDHPNERSSHTSATPRGGGVAVLVSCLLFFAIAMVSGVVTVRDALTLGVGMLVLGVIGWVDDRSGVTPRVRLAVHFAVAAWTLIMYHGLPSIRVGSFAFPLGVLGTVLAMLAIVWSTNLFNFMDGIDGLAGSQALLIFGGAGALLVESGAQSLGTISFIAAMASAGFLVWNWPPAKIFLGDVGSGALGYLVAGLAVASENNNAVPALVFVILGSAFFADATVTLLRRLARGFRPADAHRDHAYQRLARLWQGHRPVTVLAAALTMGFGAVGYFAVRSPALLLPCLAGSYAALALALVALERRAPMQTRR